MRIAFLGLGQMGAPMARRLIDAGHDVSLWNRTRSKAVEVARDDAAVADSPRDAVKGREAAITMLADPEAVHHVVFGEDGVASALDGVLIEMSTVGPATVTATASDLTVPMIDAPVLGSVPQAESGELKIFAGGETQTLDPLRPLLETMGRVSYMGPLGSGAAMKLVANSTLGALMTTLGEALLLAERLGLDRSATFDMLEGSPLGATAARKRSNIESGSYEPNFKLGLAVKDMRLIAEAAEAAGAEMKVSSAARAWIEDAERAGLGDRDYSAVVEHILGSSPSGGSG